MKFRIGIFVLVATVLVVPTYLFEGWKSGSIMLAVAVVTFCMFVVGLRKDSWALEFLALALFLLFATCLLTFHNRDDTPDPRVSSEAALAVTEQEIRRDLAPQIEGTFTYFEHSKAFGAITIQRYQLDNEPYYVDVVLRHTATGRVYWSFPVVKSGDVWQIGCRIAIGKDWIIITLDYQLPGETTPVRDFVMKNGYCPPWPHVTPSPTAS